MKESRYPTGFVCYTKDEKMRMTGSSGGIFFELAKEILNREKSFVYGAGFSDDFEVKHMKIENKEDIGVLTQSKYVQSKIGDIYGEVKEDLKNNRTVLFVGTPCQAKGLHNYLKTANIDMKNLFLTDFICHGVPSPKIWREYLDNKVRKYRSGIKKINFRNKTNGWHDYHMDIRFENGKEYFKSHYTDQYMYWFLSDYSIRKSCFNCPFRAVNQSNSDITLGDAWLAAREARKQDRGKSLVIANTEKGMDLLNKTAENIVLETTDYTQYFTGENQMMSDDKREQFFEDYLNLGQTKCFQRKYYYQGKLLKNYLKHLLYLADYKKIIGKLKRR